MSCIREKILSESDDRGGDRGGQHLAIFCLRAYPRTKLRRLSIRQHLANLQNPSNRCSEYRRCGCDRRLGNVEEQDRLSFEHRSQLGIDQEPVGKRGALWF